MKSPPRGKTCTCLCRRCATCHVPRMASPGTQTPCSSSPFTRSSPRTRPSSGQANFPRCNPTRDTWRHMIWHETRIRGRAAGPAIFVNGKKPSKSSTLLDFFIKETVEITPSQVVRNEAKEQQDTLNTWVSYFEGYSNAVRRDLTWEQLWME